MVEQLAAEAQADQVDSYGPGSLRLLGFLSPLSSYWGQDGPDQLVILLTAIEPFDTNDPTRALIGIVMQADAAGNPLHAVLLNFVALLPTELDQFTPPGYLSTGFLPWAPSDRSHAVQRVVVRYSAHRWVGAHLATAAVRRDS